MPINTKDIIGFDVVLKKARKTQPKPDVGSSSNTTSPEQSMSIPIQKPHVITLVAELKRRLSIRRKGINGSIEKDQKTDGNVPSEFEVGKYDVGHTRIILERERT